MLHVVFFSLAYQFLANEPNNSSRFKTATPTPTNILFSSNETASPLLHFPSTSAYTSTWSPLLRPERINKTVVCYFRECILFGAAKTPGANTSAPLRTDIPHCSPTTSTFPDHSAPSGRGPAFGISNTSETSVWCPTYGGSASLALYCYRNSCCWNTRAYISTHL